MLTDRGTHDCLQYTCSAQQIYVNFVYILIIRLYNNSTFSSTTLLAVNLVNFFFQSVKMNDYENYTFIF